MTIRLQEVAGEITPQCFRPGKYDAPLTPAPLRCPPGSCGQAQGLSGSTVYKVSRLMSPAKCCHYYMGFWRNSTEAYIAQAKVKRVHATSCRLVIPREYTFEDSRKEVIRNARVTFVVTPGTSASIGGHQGGRANLRH